MFEKTELKFLRTVLDAGGKIGGLHVKGKNFTRSELDAYVEWAKKTGSSGCYGLMLVRIIRLKHRWQNSSRLIFLHNSNPCALRLNKVTLYFFLAGPYDEAWVYLGRLRLELARDLNIIPAGKLHFSWITDFPLFEYDKETKQWNSVHHPFTSPKEGWENLATCADESACL